MPTIVTSVAQAAARGIYLIFKKIASAAKAAGTARAAMIALLPWGPLNTETAYQTAQVFRDTFAPDGMARTSGGYLMATKFPWIDLQIVGVKGVGAAAATKTLKDSLAADALTVPALYKGAAGNAISVVVSNPTDGVTAHFKLTISVTDSTTGLNTTEVYDNLDSANTSATYWTNVTQNPTGTKSKLVAGLVQVAALRPVNISTTLATGSDGSTPILTDYAGTPGNADKGVAVLESDPQVRFIFTDDPPGGIVGTLNAALVAHADYLNDGRFVALCGAPGESQATAISNVASLRDVHATYHYGHAKVNDDTGTTQTIPLTGAWCSLCAILTPHLSPAFKNSDFTNALKAIIGIDVGLPTTPSKVSLENAGITAWEQNSDGTITPYTDVTTDSSGFKVFEIRMRDYVAFTWAARLDQFRNGPNDDITQKDERTVGVDLLNELKGNAKRDHIFLPCIKDFGLASTESANSPTSIAAGDFTIAYQAQIFSSQRRLFLAGEIGTGVSVTISA